MKKILFIAIVLIIGIAGCKEKKAEEQIVEEKPAVGLAIDEDHFPDAVFRNALKSLNAGEDGILTDEEIDDLTLLDLSDTGLSDLHGIELLPNISSLYLNRNMLTGIDLSRNQKLTEVYCVGCERMKKITLGSQPLLEMLNFGSTDVSEIDVTGCPSLKRLYCADAPVAVIDLSQCTGLEQINCDVLLIPALDLSACPNATFVDAAGNPLGM